jgi:hypothetical protein
MFLPNRRCLSPPVRVISKIVVKRHKTVFEKVQVLGSEIFWAMNCLRKELKGKGECWS